MNHQLFKEHTEMLIRILESSSIDNKEKNHRKKELLKIYNEMKNKNQINNRYYNLSHEIRSLELLSNLGNLKVSKDSKSEAGCDFKLNNNIQIECVCSSSGNEKDNGLNKFHGSGIFDYGKKEKIILTRLTQSIKDKVKFYYEHGSFGEGKRKNTINENQPYVIFLSAGNLSTEIFGGTFGFVLNKILWGIGYEQLLIDRKTNKVVKASYTHNDTIKNHNDSDIDCNIFANVENRYISGIIFSVATLDEKYNFQNTFMFINPNAENKIHAKDFLNLIYWKENNKNVYIPRKKGKDLSYKLNKKPL